MSKLRSQPSLQRPTITGDKNMFNNLKCRHARHLLCSLLMLCASPGHAAIISASSSVVYEDEPGRGSLQVSNGPTGPLSTVSYTSTSGLAAGGYGEAAFGVLHASASAIAVHELAQTRGA